MATLIAPQGVLALAVDNTSNGRNVTGNFHFSCNQLLTMLLTRFAMLRLQAQCLTGCGQSDRGVLSIHWDQLL